jgi:hypothetical protein
MTRTACLPSQGEQAPEAGGFLATTLSALMASTSRSSSLEEEAGCCPASFRFVFPSGSLAMCNGIRRLCESNEPSEYGAGGRTGSSLLIRPADDDAHKPGRGERGACLPK